MHELLSEKLTTRESYTIERVSGLAHNCDLTVKRLAFPDVRIEVKAHGEGTGAKVGTKETIRFQQDLLTMSSHGIFVSLYSGIVGKGKVEVDVLSNNKLAVYLSSNNFDVDMIHDMLHVIYRVDGILTTADADDSAYVKVTKEDMARVQRHLKDFAVKSQTIKSHLKESISLLDEMVFEKIDCVLSGRVTPAISSKSDGVGMKSVLDKLDEPLVQAQPMSQIPVSVMAYAKPALLSSASAAVLVGPPSNNVWRDSDLYADQIKKILRENGLDCNGKRTVLLQRLAALRASK